MEKEAEQEKAEAELQKWRARLSEMEVTDSELLAEAKRKHQEYRQQLHHQIIKAAHAVETLRVVGEDAREDARIHLQYLWEALEDTWAFWTSLRKNERATFGSEF
ncbi:MAG: hypothetical protein JWM56_751 [Candidatus Peribacteria bacterium]|nr:hypothetical protein [Candidatus Peribacteria bacterium]